MVAETKETMTKMFDCWNDGFRAAFDAGRKTQETWFKSLNESTKNPLGLDGFFASTEKFTKEFPPFVGRNMDAVANTCDATFRAGLEVYRAATETAMRPEEGDFYRKGRRIWDATFDAFRTNVDAIGKAATRGIENCTAFYQNVCSEESCAKTAPKPTKAGA